MKRLFFTLLALCLVELASAQGVVPKPPAMPGFEAPVGIKHIPKNITKDTPWKAQDAENLEAYERAMVAYEGALQQHKKPPSNKAIPVPIPTLTPDPNLDLRTPILTPDPNVDLKTPVLTPEWGAEPPATLKMLPDSLGTPPAPLKKYPMKFPRK